MKTVLFRKFAFLFLFLSLITSCNQASHSKKLTQIENQYLEHFFKYLFDTTTAGYVLYGEKPLFLCAFKSVKNTVPGSAEHRDSVILTQGLKAWEKLNIKSKNYLLVFLETESEPLQEILLINKQAFLEIIRKNLSLFQFKLGSQINEHILLEKILSPHGFSTLLKGHEALQGILFGYGVENSLTYERGNALRKKTLGSSKLNPPFQFNQEPTTPEELEQQVIDYVNDQKGTGQNILDELSDFSFYTPESTDEIIPKIPFSFHTKSDESKKLLQDYKKAEQVILSLQSEDKFLDNVLERLKQ